jgi:hypothetical protein
LRREPKWLCGCPASHNLHMLTLPLEVIWDKIALLGIFGNDEVVFLMLLITCPHAEERPGTAGARLEAYEGQRNGVPEQTCSRSQPEPTLGRRGGR